MKLVINADDFGLTKSITDGIVDSIKGGYVTSTSVMVNMPYAEYAMNKAIENDLDCIGLHIVFTKGKPVVPNKNLTDKNGEFFYKQAQIERTDLNYDDVCAEIEAQIQVFKKLAKGKLHINHFTTHHFLYPNNVIRKAVFDIARKYGVPVRNELKISLDCEEAKGLTMPAMFFDDWSLVDVSYKKLESITNEIKNQNTTAELMVHTGYVDDETRATTSYLIRDVEMQVLKQAKENGLFDKIELIDFSRL